MRRVISVWLPTWPTDRLRQAMGAGAPPPDRLLATALHDGRRRIVTAVDAAAGHEGLAPGMTVTHARMLVPELVVLDADFAADLAGLRWLAISCQRHYSPLTAPDPPAGLWLDVTGCPHLWSGGEAHLLADLHDRLGRAGCAARVALADTPGAAHAVARFAPAPITLVPPGGARAATALLPIAALRLPAEMMAGLHRLGFETVSDLLRVPRAQLALRFGSEPGRRLDQIGGLLYEPIDPVFEPEAIRRRLPLAEPILTAPALQIGIERLVALLTRDLTERGLGARWVDLICERVDSTRQAVRVGLARPTRDAAHLLRLLGRRIEQIEPGFGIEAMTLAVPLAEPLRPETIGHLVQHAPETRELAALIDALSNRLGADRLYRAAVVESDVPERSVRFLPPLAPPTGVTWPSELPRPSRLLARPEPIETTALLPDRPPAQFVWRKKRHRVRQADGPERIHGEWWRADREIDALRDYFSVEDDAGSRFWLFRTGIDNEARWFLHGLF
jgi:protein ImuB